MKSLFYYFLGCFGLVLTIFLVLSLPFLFDCGVRKVILQRKGRYFFLSKRHRREILRLCYGCGAFIVLATWFWTRSIWIAFGLMSLVPILLKLILIRKQELLKRDTENEFLSFFCSLRGLIGLGITFPQAVYQLSHKRQSRFIKSLSALFHSFEKGDSLEEVFQRFVSRSGLDLISRPLILMEVAHRKGLPLCPILDGILPLIELELQGRERLKVLNKNILAQAFISALIPWLIGTVMWTFQPDFFADLFESSFFWGLGGFVLIWEGIGMWFIKEKTQFY